MPETFKKLKGRSLAEFRERGRQRASIFVERLGIFPQSQLFTNAELFRRFHIPGRRVTDDTILTYFRSRKTAKFYSSFENSEATIAEFRKRFCGDEFKIINRADRICEGFFDLLGYENLYFEDKIPNWHFDPVSRKTSPKVHWSQIKEVNAEQTGDKKVIWELNRHQYFNTLGRAYWLTKNEKYAETIFAHLESWFTANPPKIGVNWLSSLEIAFRSISWIWTLHFFKDSPKFPSEILVQMLKYLYLHGKHLETYLSTYVSPNTHLTGEALGLYFLGTFLPELKDSKRWKKLGYQIMLEALDFQVRADGVYCEQSSHYHRYTTDFYANLLILRQLEGVQIERKHREKLEQLFEFLLFITQPNGETPLFGDDDGGRLYFLDEKELVDCAPTLALGATLFNRSDFKFAAKEASAELLWLLGPEGLSAFDKLEAREPKKLSKAFMTSGFFIIRDSWNSDAIFLLIDCGEHGFLNGGHAHADALSFVLSFNGIPVLVDSGTYNYTSDVESRQIFRSTSAHNCLTVNGESSSIPNGPFSWKSTAHARLLKWHDDGNSICFRGTHNGFERFHVNYEREIELKKDGSVVLIDSIKSLDSNSYQLNFVLSPVVGAQITNNSIVVFNKNNNEQTILGIYSDIVTDNVGDKGVWKIEDCWISPRYGAKVESKKLVFTIESKGNFQIYSSFRKAGV